MEREERIAYIISQSAAAMVTALGMQAENKQREFKGEAMAYNEESFEAVITHHGISHNQVIGYLLDY